MTMIEAPAQLKSTDERARPEVVHPSESRILSVWNLDTVFSSAANHPSEVFQFGVNNQSEVYRWQEALRAHKAEVLRQLHQQTIEEIRTTLEDVLQEVAPTLWIGATLQKEDYIRLEVRWEKPVWYASEPHETIHLGYIDLQTAR